MQFNFQITLLHNKFTEFANKNFLLKRITKELQRIFWWTIWQFLFDFEFVSSWCTSKGIPSFHSKWLFWKSSTANWKIFAANWKFRNNLETFHSNLEMVHSKLEIFQSTHSLWNDRSPSKGNFKFKAHWNSASNLLS